MDERIYHISRTRRQRLSQLREWTEAVGETIQHLRSTRLSLRCQAEIRIRYSTISGISKEFWNRHLRDLSFSSAALRKLDTVVAKTKMLDVQMCSGKVLMATGLEIVEILAANSQDDDTDLARGQRLE